MKLNRRPSNGWTGAESALLVSIQAFLSSSGMSRAAVLTKPGRDEIHAGVWLMTMHLRFFVIARGRNSVPKLGQW